MKINVKDTETETAKEVGALKTKFEEQEWFNRGLLEKIKRQERITQLLVLALACIYVVVIRLVLITFSK